MSDEDEADEKGEKQLYDKAGKLKKMKHEQARDQEAQQGLGGNVRSFAILAVMMMVMKRCDRPWLRLTLTRAHCLFS